MATTVAARVARSILAARSSPLLSYPFVSERFISTASSISQGPPVAGFVWCSRLGPFLSHSMRVVVPGAARLDVIRCRMNRLGSSADSPLNSGSNFSDRPANAMIHLFAGCDGEHWHIIMDKPGGEGATKQQMIDCYVQTLAKVVGSEEEAKKNIYNVSCERTFGFGCEIDMETSYKLEGLPGVLFVYPDFYVDPENKDYGDELLVNGEIVQRSPERQRRVDGACT